MQRWGKDLWYNSGQTIDLIIIDWVDTRALARARIANEGSACAVMLDGSDEKVNQVAGFY